MLGNVLSFRSSWPSLFGGVNANNVPKNLAPASHVTMSNLTGLTPTRTIRFSGDNQTKDTRRPQGVAVWGGTIITGWYFRQSVNAGNCKLTLTDADGMTKDVCPVQLVNGKFEHIDSHAGGLGIIGPYLYMADEDTNSLRVFDLFYFFNRQDNLSAMNPADSFANIYDYILPEIGRIYLTPPNGVNISYMSATVNGFVLGNFFDPDNALYAAGGKSFVWEMPAEHDSSYEFPVPGTLTQHEPTFNSGPDSGAPLTRIQGVVITPNRVMIINRSWSTQTQSLVVEHLLHYGKFFNGTDDYPQLAHEKNWLYGCEGLAFTQEGEVVTVTEFVNARNLEFFSIADLEGLVFTPLTIQEHEAQFALMELGLESMYAELEYYRSQIDDAIQEGLPEFDKDLFIPGTE